MPIVNANDRSTLLLVQGSYSVTQNVTLDFGLRGAGGVGGTEFGGMRPTPAGGAFATPPTRLFARVAVYF